MVELGPEPDGEPAELADLLEEVREAVARLQPRLAVRAEDGRVIAEGNFVVSAEGCPDDIFSVQILVPPEFPVETPIVFETGGRIPRTAERHVFPEGENCCLGTFEEWLIRSDDHSFAAFLDGPIAGYFYSQSVFELSVRVNGPDNGEWPLGAREHGPVGVVQSYCDAIGIPEDFEMLVNYLTLLRKDRVKGHVRCPCGSKRRLRSCHGGDFRRLQGRVPPALAERMIQRLRELLDQARKAKREEL